MSRTIKEKPYKPFSHECGWARKFTRRLYRKICKRLVKNEKYDEIPPKKGTQGWITW